MEVFSYLFFWGFLGKYSIMKESMLQQKYILTLGRFLTSWTILSHFKTFIQMIRPVSIDVKRCIKIYFHIDQVYQLWVISLEFFKTLSSNPTEWSNTLKQLVDWLFEYVWPFCGVGVYCLKLLTEEMSYFIFLKVVS